MLVYQRVDLSVRLVLKQINSLWLTLSLFPLPSWKEFNCIEYFLGNTGFNESLTNDEYTQYVLSFIHEKHPSLLPFWKLNLFLPSGRKQNWAAYDWNPYQNASGYIVTILHIEIDINWGFMLHF